MRAVQSTDADFRAAYLELLKNGELARRAEIACAYLEDCDLCARYCHVHRRATTQGAVCRTGELARVHSAGPHHGEEDPLRGWNGSGTIFFSWCNLRCVYCQNYKYSHVRDFVEVNQAAVKEMHSQVGDLQLDARGIARRGLLVRHLVMPGNIAGTDRVLAFLAQEISPDTYLNLMDQYRPCYRADEYPPLDRPLGREEFLAALEIARRYGLRRLDGRLSGTSDHP